MGVLKIIRHTDANPQYLCNAINYILHGHTDPDNIGSPNTCIYDIYDQMYAVKKYYGKTGGNPLFHFVVIYDARTAYDVNRAKYLTARIADYFAERYQIIWCVHEKALSKRYGKISSLYHAHFVMNSVSFVDGKMYSNDRAEIYYRLLEYIKSVTGDRTWIVDYNCSNGKPVIEDDNGFFG